MGDEWMRIEIHSKQGCPSCEDAKEWLVRHRLSFEEFRHDDLDERQSFYDSLGLVGNERRVPKIFLIDVASGNREVINGFEALKASGLA